MTSLAAADHDALPAHAAVSHVTALVAVGVIIIGGGVSAIITPSIAIARVISATSKAAATETTACKGRAKAAPAAKVSAAGEGWPEPATSPEPAPAKALTANKSRATSAASPKPAAAEGWPKAACATKPTAAATPASTDLNQRQRRASLISQNIFTSHR